MSIFCIFLNILIQKRNFWINLKVLFFKIKLTKAIMLIQEMLEIIDNITLEKIQFKIHAQIRLNQRDITKEQICMYLLNKKIIGIHHQRDNIYKLWCPYNTREDITIVISYSNGFLIIITVIKEKISRRTKNEK